MIQKIGRCLLLLSFSLVALATANAGLQKKSNETQKKSPEKQLEALIAEFNKLQSDYRTKSSALSRKYQKLYNAAKTPAEKAKVITEFRSKLPKNPTLTIVPKITKLLDGSTIDLKSDLGLKAMIWVIKNQPRNRTAISKYFKAIGEYHAMSAKIADALPAFQRVFGQNPEPLFRKVLDKNKNHRAKALACYSLAGYLAAKNRRAKKPNPEIAKLYERVVSEFGKVMLGGSTLAKLVEAPLFEAKHLQIGKVVPDIVAQDIDGKEFKISDYRGKVVVIDFWGDW